MVQDTMRRPRCLKTLEIKLNKFFATEPGRHLLNSRKELLLAVRALIDLKIAWLDSLGREAEAKNIEVE